jgi:carbamoylphosphate synthase small subunit
LQLTFELPQQPPILLQRQSQRQHLVAEVSLEEPKVYGVGNPIKIMGVDCGMKYNNPSFGGARMQINSSAMESSLYRRNAQVRRFLFTDLNDGSNEGFIHKSRPYFTAQFHPEFRNG